MGPLAARPAQAAGIDEQGALLISVDRLFGIANSRATREQTTGQNVVIQRSTSRTDLSLLTSTPGSVYSLPRLAVDFAVASRFTVGGALGFATGSSSVSSTSGSTTTEVDNPDTTSFLVAPRVGFAMSLGNVLGLWLRGGITYFRSTTESETVLLNQVTSFRAITSGVSFNAEPTLAIMVAPGFGFTLGVVVDLPLTGEQRGETRRAGTTTTTEVDFMIRNLGVMVGLLGRI
jgi:hypothetical protein